MRYGSSERSTAVLVALAFLAVSSVGCFAHSRGERDWDDNPVVNTGAGATILYPGQTGPTYPPSAPSGAGGNTAPQAAPGSAGSAPTTQVGPNGERQSGAAQPGRLPVTMIGGAEQENTGHLSWKQEPAWWKYMLLPFAVIAAPFKALAGGDPEPGPELPRTPPVSLGAPPAPTPAPTLPDVDYETEQVEALERELDRRRASQGSESRASDPAATPQSSYGSGGGALSIADELAALKRRDEPATAPPRASAAPPRASAPPQPPRTAAGAPGADADGRVDRDRDGRIDQWIYRDGAALARVELDESGDGRPDRILHYDPQTQQVRLVTEDLDDDGTPDSWTVYEGGKIARRRSDRDFDGNVDTWSFYRDGVITRHERDSNGDGFRDRIGRYENGKLVREDQDRDGDGRADTMSYFDASEQMSRREEDTDHDGRTDVISYYEAGRLARRELLRHDDPPETETR